jgi:hypothetical protein
MRTLLIALSVVGLIASPVVAAEAAPVAAEAKEAVAPKASAKAEPADPKKAAAAPKSKAKKAEKKAAKKAPAKAASKAPAKAESRAPTKAANKPPAQVKIKAPTKAANKPPAQVKIKAPMKAAAPAAPAPVKPEAVAPAAAKAALPAAPRPIVKIVADPAAVAVPKTAAEAQPEAATEALPAPAVSVWLMLLAPETNPELATKVQALVLGNVAAWSGHAVAESANLTNLPADLQVQVQEGCRLRDCRTAALAGLSVDRAVIFEVSSSASSMSMTVFDAQGETLAKVEASCVGCADDPEGLARGVAAVAAEAAAQMAPKTAGRALEDAADGAPTAEIEATGGRFAAERAAVGGPLARQRKAVPKGVLRVRARSAGPTQWKPSKLALGSSAGLALGGVTMSILTVQAYGEYVDALKDERGRGEIDGISATGKLRQNLAVTAFLLSGAALVTSAILEREAVQ